MLGLGLRATGPLRVPARDGRRPADRPAGARSGSRRAGSRRGPHHDRALRIGIGGPDRLPSTIDKPGRRVLRDGDAVVIALPVFTDRSGTLATGRLGLTGRSGSYSLPATFRGEMAELIVAAPAVAREHAIPRGRYELTAHLGSEDLPGLAVGAAHVRDDGRLVVLGIAREPLLNRLASWASWYGEILRSRDPGRGWTGSWLTRARRRREASGRSEAPRGPCYPRPDVPGACCRLAPAGVGRGFAPGAAPPGHLGHPLPPPPGPIPRPGRHEEARLGHGARQRLVDPRPAPPDGRVLDLRVGHRAPPRAGLPALHLRGAPALEVVRVRGQRRDERRRQQGQAHPPDRLSEARPARIGGVGGRRRLRRGA